MRCGTVLQPLVVLKVSGRSTVAVQFCNKTGLSGANLAKQN